MREFSLDYLVKLEAADVAKMSYVRAVKTLQAARAKKEELVKVVKLQSSLLQNSISDTMRSQNWLLVSRKCDDSTDNIPTLENLGVKYMKEDIWLLDGLIVNTNKYLRKIRLGLASE